MRLGGKALLNRPGAKHWAFSLALGALLVGCDRSGNEAKQRVSDLRDVIIAENWRDLGPFLADGSRDGFSMTPEEFAEFMYNYANAEPRKVHFSASTPSSIPPQLADSAQRRTVFISCQEAGKPSTVVALTTRHTADDKWVVRMREIQASLLGILHPDFEERYRCMATALTRSHVATFGWKGHYTSAPRIEAFLEGRIGRDRLYSATQTPNWP